MIALILLLAWSLCVAIAVALGAARSARRARKDAEIWRESAACLALVAQRWKGLAMEALELLEDVMGVPPRGPVEPDALTDELARKLERAGVYVERVASPEDLPFHLAGPARRKPTTH